VDLEPGMRRPNVPKSKSKAKSPLRLSILERLPVEILQMIFDLWPSPSLPQSSPILGRNLSSRTQLFKTCHALWLASDVDEDEEMSPEALEREILKRYLMDAPWFDLRFTLELELQLPSPEDDKHDVHERMPTARSSNYWDECDLPPKILKGPWKAEDLSFFILLCPRLNLPLNLCRQDVKNAAMQGVLNCISTNNWFVLYHLFQMPYDFARTSGFVSIDDKAIKEWMPLLLMDLKRVAVTSRDVGVLPCKQNQNFLRVTQNMIRSAVLDHGCDKGVVSLLLLQGLYDPKQINYLDPELWAWAEKNTRHMMKTYNSEAGGFSGEEISDQEECTYLIGTPPGVWLKMMLRAVLRVAEHLSLPEIPQELRTQDVQDQSKRNFQRRKAQLLLQCFKDDIEDTLNTRGDAENVGWYCAGEYRAASDTSRELNQLFKSLNNRSVVFSLYRDPQGLKPAWVNQFFNESRLESWLQKPYVGTTFDSHVCTFAELKLMEVLQHTRSCDSHVRVGK